MKWVIIKGVKGQLYYENGEAHAGPLNKIE